MAKFYVVSFITLGLVAQCALAQYQTAPAYGNGYKQQRKMAPNPQTYGQQQQQQSMSNYGAAMQEMDNSYEGEQGTSGYKQSGGRQQGRQSGSAGYGSDAAGQMMSGAGGYGSKQGGQKYEEPQHPPMPFNWGYDINDGYGTTQFHKENGDEQGKRTGSYGYMDPYGVYRHVNYVADENGFRATVKTNEPGTANEAPADVDWTAEEPPANVFMGNKDNSGYGSASSSSYGSGASDGGSGGQYGSATGSGSGNGKQYGASSSAGEQQQYGMGSMGSSMGGSARQYGGASPSASGKQYGGGAGMMAGAGKQRYGGGATSMMMATAGAPDAGQYGASQGAQAPMMMTMPGGQGAGGSQYGAMMMGAGRGNNKSRRYNSKQMSGSKTGKQQYGGSMGSAMGADESATQRYDSMGGADSGQSAMQEYGAAMPTSMGAGGMRMMAGGQQQYGAGSAMAALEDEAANQQQQYGSSASADSALAQQYGPSVAAMPEMAGVMDGASVYSSTRMQPASSSGSYGAGETKGQQPQAAAAANDYGSQRGASSGYGSKSMLTGSNMDYKKQAKNIAALVKRY